MENLIRTGRVFYGTGIAGIGIQQFIYSDFRPVLVSYWPSSLPGATTWAYITGAALILAGSVIITMKKARIVSLALAIFFFLLFLCFHLYYQLFLSPNSFELGLWTNPLKELAFAGGAFIIAVSFPEERSSAGNNLFLILGRVFFSIMLITFGIDHFLYTKFVATLVPGWIPFPVFWTYFAAVALIGSGICILLNIKAQFVALLLGIMLLLWLVLLHIPRAIVEPAAGKGNELTSVFQALAFSGIAFVLAFRNTARPNKA